MSLKDRVAGYNESYQPGVVLVKFAKQVVEAEAKKVAESLGYTLGEQFMVRQNWYRVNVPAGSEHSAVAEFRLNDLVVTAEVNAKASNNPPMPKV